MKAIVVAHENSDGIQAIYVDGILKAYDETIYVSTILEFVTLDEPITLRQLNVDLPEGADWPGTLEALVEIDARSGDDE